ncbi:TolC family protein [Curvibacter sp. APW13]|uniref:TolC family protein n=1 Tax=Curvibacter sp. APW13 TaxID=3077236 RepID=UPI0028DE7C90|nr:TolC family protein [Curvibacter sp. APW13]MDT8992968.1 TolC family protein [Curvibacter sp. APW13]
MALLAAGVGAFAQATPGTGQAMDFSAAWSHLVAHSGKLAAAHAALRGKQLQGEGLQGLGGPSVAVSGASYAYNANLTVDLDPVNQRLLQAGQALQAPLAGLPVPAPSFPSLPSSYTYNQHGTGNTASLSLMWPLYMGGATDAARALVSAQADEALADTRKTSHELMTVLVQRYFGAQLAARAASLRQAAYSNVQEHDRAVEKMLAAGVVSRVERLQARAALEDAHRNALKAQDDAELTAIALARTVGAPGAVTPQSPLFVWSRPVQPMAYFLEAALQNHPGLAKVAAKKAQAESLHAGEEGLRRPQLFAFGQHALTTGNPDWVLGVGARWTLYDSVDRDKMAAASLQQVAQAEHTDAQARNDIALLVERNWRLVEQARRQFFSLQPGADVADEVLRLRKAGLREGTSTAVDLMDAEMYVVKVQTERAQAAYEYVMALANLLEGCGLSEEFAAYMAGADVKVE